MVTRSKAAVAVALVSGCAASHASAQSLTTLFGANNNGSPGGIVFFDASINNPIIIDALDVNTAQLGPIGVTVYTISGSYIGNTGNQAAWTQVSTGVGTGMGLDVPSPVTLDTPFQLSAGNYGIAIVAAAPGQPSFPHHYTNGTASNTFYSNADLSLTLGAAGNTPFPASVFSPRVFNGTIHYDPANPNAVGACCFNDGTCQFITQANCQSGGGAFRGENVTCAQANCPQPGACCIAGACSVMLESQCTAQNGIWQGGAASCTGVSCPPAWQVMAPAPEARSRAAGALVDGFFYYMGGEATGGIRNLTAWRLDTGSNTWSPIADMPPLISGSGVSNVDAAAIGTDIYIVGGWDGLAATNRVIRYDTIANTWTEILTDPLPTTIFANALVAHNGKLYVLGGSTASGILSTLTYIYDPAATAGTRWSTATGLSSPRQYPGAAAVGDDIYVGGGIGASTATEFNSVEVYDTVAGTWSMAPAMTFPRGGMAGYEADGQFVAAAGGWASYLTSTEAFDGTSWSAYVPVNFGTRTFAYDGDGNILVKAGGWNGGFMAETEMLVIGGGPECYPNCDGSTVPPILNVDDFTCFINEFAAGQSLPHAQQINHYANCDGSTVAPVLNVDDFTCFINEFAAGCN